MPVLTDRQVAGIVITAGPPSGTTAAQWVAVARRESHFNTDIQDFMHSGHWGLWQIDERHWTMAGMPAANSQKDFASTLTSPLINFSAAKIVYQNQGWGAWRASGGVPRPSAADNAAVANPDFTISKSGGGDVGGDPGAVPISIGNLPGINTTLDAFKAALQPIAAASKWVGDPGNWLRILEVIGGIALGLVALNVVLQPAADTVANSPAFKTATKAAIL